MAVEVKRKKGESAESLLRRFRQRVMQSGIQYRAKEVQFRFKPKSHLKQKAAALRRLEIRAKREYLRRIGKLPPEDKDTQSFTGRRKSIIR